MTNSEEKIINSIFDEDFDISKVDPKYFNDFFCISAIVNEYKNIELLDSYISESIYGYIWFALWQNNRFKEFLKETTITHKLEKELDKVFSIALIQNRDEIIYSLNPFSYRIRWSEVVYKQIGRGVCFTFDDFFDLAYNKNLPHLLVKKLEEVFQHTKTIYYTKVNTKTQRAYTKEELSEYMDKKIETLKKHPNYSTAKYILKSIKDEQK